MTWETDRDAIEDHYRRRILEEDRVSGLARLEVLRVREIIGRWLPPAPAEIGDVGGGPGTYAVPLARYGYRVHLIDPVDTHVERARERGGALLASCSAGSALALDWHARSLDACLFFGPMYHLTSQEERLRALDEARRVLRPGGYLMAMAISRFASTYAGLVRQFMAHPGYEDLVRQELEDGTHLNPDPDAHPEWFTTSHSHTPEEFVAELQTGGFRVETVLAVDGPAGRLANLEWWLDDSRRERVLLDSLRRVEAEPSLLGASPQILAVAVRPA